MNISIAAVDMPGLLRRTSDSPSGCRLGVRETLVFVAGRFTSLASVQKLMNPSSRMQAMLAT